jgi:hypothetical protein
MKPPYDITPKILKLIASVSGKTGKITANLIDRPSPQLPAGTYRKALSASCLQKPAIKT